MTRPLAGPLTAAKGIWAPYLPILSHPQNIPPKSNPYCRFDWKGGLYCNTALSHHYLLSHALPKGLTLVIQVGNNSDLNIKRAIAIFEMFHLKQFKSQGTIVRVSAQLRGLVVIPNR